MTALATHTENEIPRPVQVKDLESAVPLEAIVSMCKAMLKSIGTLSVMGVVSEVEEPRPESKDWVRFWISDTSGTSAHRFRLSILREKFEASGVVKGDTVYATGKIDAWPGRRFSMGFSFNVDALSKNVEGRKDIPLTERYSRTVSDRDMYRREAEVLKKRLEEIQKISQATPPDSGAVGTPES